MDVDDLAGLSAQELQQQILPQIGNTPMRPVIMVIEGQAKTVHLKLEGQNPGGSIKDRTALSLVQDLEARGRVGPGSVLIDSTSGNLGVALAYQARAYGYGFMAIVDPKTTPENLAKMQKLGAQIEMIHDRDSTGGYLLTRLARVDQICASSPQYVWTNQYENPANPGAHYRGTGPELLRQMDGRLDVLFVAVSTGGTLAGVGRYFRQASPRTRLIGVDAKGSVIFNEPPGPRLLTGIGSSRASTFLTDQHYDDYVLVSDEEAFAFSYALLHGTGLKVGGSTGAILAAAGRYLAANPEVERVACLSPDRGENYDTTIFSPSWLASKHVTLSPDHMGPVDSIQVMGSRAPRRAFDLRQTRHYIASPITKDQTA